MCVVCERERERECRCVFSHMCIHIYVAMRIIKKKKRVRRTAFVETAFTTGDAVIYYLVRVRWWN